VVIRSNAETIAPRAKSLFNHRTEVTSVTMPNMPTLARWHRMANLAPEVVYGPDRPWLVQQGTLKRNCRREPSSRLFPAGPIITNQTPRLPKWSAHRWRAQVRESLCRSATRELDNGAILYAVCDYRRAFRVSPHTRDKTRLVGRLGPYRPRNARLR